MECQVGMRSFPKRVTIEHEVNDMAKPLRGGYIVSRPPDVSYTVEVLRDGNRITVEPNGVVVQGGRGLGVWINHAGVDDGILFQLPEDPGFLRGIADAINGLADKIERR